MSKFVDSLLSDYLYNLEAFIESGQVMIGAIKTVRCAAIATEGHAAVVALVRRDGEPIIDLLARLDAALGRFADERTRIDEVGTHLEAPHKSRK